MQAWSAICCSFIRSDRIGSDWTNRLGCSCSCPIPIKASRPHLDFWIRRSSTRRSIHLDRVTCTLSTWSELAKVRWSIVHRRSWRARIGLLNQDRIVPDLSRSRREGSCAVYKARKWQNMKILKSKLDKQASQPASQQIFSSRVCYKFFEGKAINISVYIENNHPLNKCVIMF